MRLYVCVLEARGLPHGDGGLYARVKVGRQRARTRAVEPADPGGAAAWNEEFVLAAGAEDDVVEVGVARRRDGRREVLGRVKLPVPPPVQAAASGASDGGTRSVLPTWFALRPKHRRKGRAAAAADCGACTHFASLAKINCFGIFVCRELGEFVPGNGMVGRPRRARPTSGRSQPVLFRLCQMMHASFRID
jgi:hypothetical protein